jgi:hypothetical protein
MGVCYRKYSKDYVDEENKSKQNKLGFMVMKIYASMELEKAK